jgi:dihydroorotate dehydrogenase electron transfer subunit
VRPREFTSTIADVKPVMGDAALITLAAPTGFADAVRAGEFVDVLCRAGGSFDPLLRRPYSLARVDRREETFTILVRPYGRGSEWLVRQPAGTDVDVLGPLGNRFDVPPKATNMLMVAGGVGAAPLVMLADAALAQGKSVTYLMGGMTEEALLPVSVLPGEVEYVVATDDGSRGHHGFVTDLVLDYLSWADEIYACGPEPMFQSLRRVILAHRMGKRPRVQVSVERTMACGLGACLGCVVETRSGMQASCVEGPVYDMDEVVWS